MGTASCVARFRLQHERRLRLRGRQVLAKVLCLAWTSDGQFLALGMFDGGITIRDRQGAEKSRIDRNSPARSHSPSLLRSS